MRRSRSSVLALLVLVAVASPTRGDEPATSRTLWEDVAEPEVARHGTLILRAAELLAGGNAAGALPLLLDAAALAPNDPVGRVLLGWAHYRLRGWAACADALGAVRGDRAIAPPFADAVTAEQVDEMLGICLALSGRLDDAVAHYRRLLAGPPGADGIDALQQHLGNCYQALGRLDDAIFAYTAALALTPRRVVLHAALAVAHDRDERVERAREAMARALAIDPLLTELSSPGTIFIPPADHHYYLGLAHQVAVEGGPHRAQAIAHFRKYVDLTAPGTPWLPRAKLHLLELGPPAFREDDIKVLPVEAPDGPPIVKALLALGPELQGCFENESRAVVRATVAYHGHGKDPKPALPTVSVSSVGPDRVSSQVIECIEKTLVTRKHAVRQMTRIQIAIGPP